MSEIFKAMRAKKKRAVDPDAAPRPTLLGHEKEMKTWRQQFSEMTERSIQQSVEINMLRRKVNRLESQIDAMTSVVNRKLR